MVHEPVTTMPDATQQRVQSIIARHCNSGARIGTGSILDELGMDSLDLVELIIDLEVEFNISGNLGDHWTVNSTVSEVMSDVDRLVRQRK